MRRSLVAVAACVALAVAAPVLQVVARPAWGVMGHYMTAAIAEGFLSTKAQAGCANMLPWVDGDIGLVASWADSTARWKYPWSSELHYIDTPDWACDYSRTRDCIGSKDGIPMACVDGAIQNYTRILSEGSAPLTELQDALMFLIHFIGDIHQPLHVGFTSDAGGNTEVGTFCELTNRKLHQLWDDDMISRRIDTNFGGVNSSYLQYFMNELQSPTGKYYPSLASWRECAASSAPHKACSDLWAQESIKLACTYAYKTPDGAKIATAFDLCEPYYSWALPTVELRLASGGIRLAEVLNSLFESSGLERFTLPRADFLREQRKEECEHSLAAAMDRVEPTVWEDHEGRGSGEAERQMPQRIAME